MKDEKKEKDGLFQTMNPKTGRPYPAWRFHYIDRYGKQRTGTGDTSKQRTKDLKKQVQARERAIRKQWIDAPKLSAKPRAFEDVMNEFLAHGNSKGGLGGRPWSAKHSQKRGFYLRFWRDRLRLSMMSDLLGCLGAVERELVVLQKAGKAGKTLQNYADGLAAFCDWCVDREYLDSDPLRRLKPYDITPQTQRRALTSEEIRQFLQAIEEKGTKYAKRRRLGYELAFSSGLRKGELRALTVQDLDVKRGGLILRPEWTKNRRGGFQPLSAILVQRLRESAVGKSPTDPLVFVSRESAKAMKRDLERAEIPWETPEGKADFHALRVAYTTFVLEAGADIKTAQTLVRHLTPGLTLNTYGRARSEQLAKVADAVGQMLFAEKSTTEVQAPIERSELVGVSAGEDSGSDGKKVMGREGFEPP